MRRVILDSNFLFLVFQFKIDIFDEMEALIGRFEPVVLSTTVKELEELTKRGSEKLRRQASAALKMAGRCKVMNVEMEPGETFDDVILRIAKEWRYPVATNDRTLRRRLRGEDVPTIFLRQRSHLEIEGYIETSD